MKNAKARTDARSADVEPPAQAKGEQLEYIRQMLVELRAMAADAEAPTLAYLLEMSALEAAEALNVHRFRADLFTDR